MTELLPRPTVLLYGFTDPGRLAAVKSWLHASEIRALEVSPRDWNQPLGALLELPGFARRPTELPDGGPREEMLVMFAFRDRMLGDLLQFFRDRGLPPVALKAMVTPTNIHWDGARLRTELSRERDYILQHGQKKQ